MREAEGGPRGAVHRQPGKRRLFSPVPDRVRATEAGDLVHTPGLSARGIGSPHATTAVRPPLLGLGRTSLAFERARQDHSSVSPGRLPRDTDREKHDFCPLERKAEVSIPAVTERTWPCIYNPCLHGSRCVRDPETHANFENSS